MKKLLNCKRRRYPLLSYDLKMKLSTLFILVTFFTLQANDSYAQRAKITLNLNNVSVGQLLDEIESTTEFQFVYKIEDVDLKRIVSISVKNEGISKILNDIFENTNTTFNLNKRRIYLVGRKPSPPIKSQKVDSTIPVQQSSVNGVVTDSDGVPLPGANIIEKGTTNGVTADFDGNFFISVKDENAVLVVSYIGFSNKEVPINGQTNISVMLEESAAGLDEVVVVGYGTQKKRDVIGSMVSIKGEDIAKTPTTNLADNLQGMASGVMVNSRSGHPGSAPEIKIRGINSINLSSDPLWIVDGIPIFTGSSELNRDGVKAVSPISMLNPNDITSIEVLKDAAATAIYGSRASGGVILVTTKSAQSGKTGVKISYDMGVSSIPFSQEDIFVDSKTWWRLSDTAAANSGTVAPDPASIMAIQFWGDRPDMSRAEAEATNVDQLNAVTQDALFTQIGFSANKGFETGGVLFSLNYRNEDGLIRNNDFERLTSRINFNFKPLKSVEIGINSNFVYLKTNGVRSAQGKGAGGWANWSHTLPWWKIYDENSQTGYWAVNSGYNMTAFSDRDLTRYDVDQYRSINNAYVQWLPTDGLSIRGEVGVDLNVNNSSYWRSGLLAPSPPYFSQAQEQSVTRSIVNYNVYANYNKVFNEIHSFDFTLGTEASRNWSYTRTFAGDGLQTEYPELRNPLQLNSMAGYQGGDTYIKGFFGRANYKLFDRYMLNASVRRDGHSAFNEENRWANFYAVGLGWILSDENFMKDSSTISLLKLRGSYGITGNTAVSNSMTYMSWGLNTSSIWGVDYAAGSSTVGPLGSADLKWETTTNMDFGLDFGLFSNRINGSVAFYTQKVEDLILRGNVQPSVGFNNNQIYENAGDMKNWGFEFNISSSNIQTDNFTWKTDFNFSTNHNKIIILNETEKGKGKEDAQVIRKEGEALNTWYLANYVEVDPERGIPMIEERDSDIWDNEFRTVATGSIIPATSTNVADNRMVQSGKSPLPTFYGGLSNTFAYKNFDLNMSFSFEGGNWLWNSLYAENHNVMSEVNTINDVVGKFWEKPGDIAEYPLLLGGSDGWYYDSDGNPSEARIGYNTRQTSKWLERGDYIKLRNLQLGYTLPKSAGMDVLSPVRFYIGVTNLFTITGYKGLNPESLNDLPIPRTYTFGISINL
ncbi:TonB-dependent receptor [Kriegella aquimaris]|uniref:TonB-linked outer membrane protein, SusC/RagA family n=1 Tax=Kriegella aquimaris TaxID=192904 RepID=A0A1G9TMX9_9FLAO|nr:TonB-dependent receptor [Kriegella aquimaris]SDM48992.1 TonB-linked outer membrane protein, SusC/RagA family [Kriegella aquimaris]